MSTHRTDPVRRVCRCGDDHRSRLLWSATPLAGQQPRVTSGSRPPKAVSSRSPPGPAPSDGVPTRLSGHRRERRRTIRDVSVFFFFFFFLCARVVVVGRSFFFLACSCGLGPRDPHPLKIRKSTGRPRRGLTSQIFFDESRQQRGTRAGAVPAHGRRDTPNNATQHLRYRRRRADRAVTPGRAAAATTRTFAVGVTGLAGAVGGAPNGTTAASALSGARFAGTRTGIAGADARGRRSRDGRCASASRRANARTPAAHSSAGGRDGSRSRSPVRRSVAPRLRLTLATVPGTHA